MEETTRDVLSGMIEAIRRYIESRLEHMTDPQNRTRYRETALSLRTRLLAALDLNPVRAFYALRTALMLSAAT